MSIVADAGLFVQLRIWLARVARACRSPHEAFTRFLPVLPSPSEASRYKKAQVWQPARQAQGRKEQKARTVSVPMARPIIRSMAVNAVKGQHRSQRLLTELLGGVEPQDLALHNAPRAVAIAYKIGWEHEFARRAKHGLTGLQAPYR